MLPLALMVQQISVELLVKLEQLTLFHLTIRLVEENNLKCLLFTVLRHSVRNYKE